MTQSSYSQTDWKSRLYDGYVSSGQATSHDALERDLNPADLFLGRAPYVRNIIKQHFPANRESRILDLGCGHGIFLYYLQQSGYHNASGVDISPEQVDLATKLGVRGVKLAGLLSELHQTPSESVDVILLMDVLEHLENTELFEILDETYRVLSPGGAIVAHVPNAEGIYGMRIRYGDLTHERAFAPKSAQQLLQTIGFKTVRCFEDKPEIHGIKSLIRKMIWTLGTASHRLLLTAETGQTHFVLSQNMLVTARKSENLTH